MTENLEKTDLTNKALDEMERLIKDNLQSCNFEVKHIFTKGMYSRAIFMPAGSLLTSKIHLTEHQYIISIGRAIVYENDGTHEVCGPYHGVTKPNTRRALYILEDTIWTTFHPIDFIEEKDYTEEEVADILLRIEAQIIEPRNNKLLNT